MVDGDRQVAIIVRVEEESRNGLFQMQNVRVPTVTCAQVTLFVLAEIEIGIGPSVIERYDRPNLAKIEADLAAGAVLAQRCRRSRRCPP